MPDADAYFDIVRTSIAAELAIPLDSISTSTRFGDLGLDSLDVLNVTFRIEQQINRKLPVQKWLEEIGESDVSLEEFTVSDLCRQLTTIQ
jgi:acyl carrier protein